MLPKRDRITSARFDEIIARGSRYTSALFTYYYHTTTSHKASLGRFAAVAPKKILAKAVQRNALRRRIYRALTASKVSVPNTDIILVARTKAISAAFGDIKNDITSSFSRIVVGQL